MLRIDKKGWSMTIELPKYLNPSRLQLPSPLFNEAHGWIFSDQVDYVFNRELKGTGEGNRNHAYYSMIFRDVAKTLMRWADIIDKIGKE